MPIIRAAMNQELVDYDSRHLYIYKALVPPRNRWREIAGQGEIQDFVYKFQALSSDLDIDTSNFSLDDWLKLRRWAPDIESELDEIDKEAFAAVAGLVLGQMLSLGIFVLVIWLLRKKGVSLSDNSENHGSANIIGDNSHSEVNNSVTVNLAPPSQPSCPILVILQPGDALRTFPVSSNYDTDYSTIVDEAITLINHADPKERIEGLLSMRMRAKKEELSKVGEAILDSDSVVSRIAVETAAERDYREAIPQIIALLNSRSLSHEDGQAATFSLLQLSDSTIIQFLAKVFSQHTDKEFLCYPIKSACLGQKSRFRELIQATQSRDSQTRMGAVSLLGDIFAEHRPPLRGELLLN